MVVMFVWMLAIGGANHGGAYPAMLDHTMFVDKASCDVAKNNLEYNTVNTSSIDYPTIGKISCINVKVLVQK